MTADAPTDALDQRLKVGNGWGLDRHEPRAPNSARGVDAGRFEVEFEKTTIGAQHYFNPRVRVAINYEMARGSAPTLAGSAGLNANLEGIGNRIALQEIGLFSR